MRGDEAVEGRGVVEHDVGVVEREAERLLDETRLATGEIRVDGGQAEAPVPVAGSGVTPREQTTGRLCQIGEIRRRPLAGGQPLVDFVQIQALLVARALDSPVLKI